MARSLAGRTREYGALVRFVLLFFGVYSVALGLFMAIAPGTFFDLLGPFGVRNDHYARDYSTFELANGVVLLLAVRLPSWRVAALVLTAVQWVLHTANHLLDIGDADPHWVGVFVFFALLAGTAALVYTAYLAHRLAEPWVPTS